LQHLLLVVKVKFCLFIYLINEQTESAPTCWGPIFLWGKMDRFVVMVDAGYFLRQAIEIASNRASTKRGELDITNPDGLVRALIDKGKATLDLTTKELLRVYWYDGVMSAGLTAQQRSITQLPDVHFRAGIVNSAGQQKGVDSLIVTDLIELATNHAICDAVLVTGDSDLAIGIDLAQKKGVRIAVIGVEDLSVGVSHKQSFEITSRTDRIGRLGGADISAVVRYVPSVTSQTTAVTPQMTPAVQHATTSNAVTLAARAAANSPLTPADRERIEVSVKAFIAQQAQLSGMVDPSTKRISATVDRALIFHVFTDLAHGKLTDAEKIYARDLLRAELGV
jgi:hypothetical protein